MSRVDELIERLCPNGVEFSSLGREVRIRNGKDYKSLAPGDVPVYGTGGVMEHVADSAYPGPSVLIPRKGSLDKLYYVGGPFWTVDTIFYTEIGERLEPKFLYYLLQTFRLARLNQAGGVPSLTQTVLNGLKIPVPPLEVQREIVGILDRFTQLEAELEAELEARREQYLYYRQERLSEFDHWASTPLGELAVIQAGSAVSRQSIEGSPGPYPVINSGREPLGYIAAFNTESDPIGITSRGAGVGSVTWCEGRYFRGNLNYSTTIRRRDLVDVRFLYHLLLFMQPRIAQLCTFQGIPALNKSNLEKLEVHLPGMVEQRRIAHSLDHFDALVNDLSIGLPAELAARRKQYEYYRDKLLTFKELSA